MTVLSVQAQAYLEDARATAGGMTLRGHVSFQALYTQGDLTRIRAMETTCDFEHSIDAPELQPDMRVNASVAVQETEGTAASEVSAFMNPPLPEITAPMTATMRVAVDISK